MIEIACCIDDNFTMPCGVVLTSVCENNKSEKVRFHIISDSLSEKNRNSLRSIAEQYNQKIRFYPIDASRFSGFPVSHYIRIATYFRILLPHILTGDLKKVLYLDCDLVVRGSLKEIWEQDITGYAVGAVRDAVNNDIRFYNRLQYEVEKGYFNAGVLLINLEYWRKNDIPTQTLNYIQTFPERCETWDQDALNYILQDSKKWLPFRYNVLTYFYHKIGNVPIERSFWPEIRIAIRKPLILHYASAAKPWLYDCDHPYKSEFFRYLALTEWRCCKPGSLALLRHPRKLAHKILEGLRLLAVPVSPYEVLPERPEEYK